MLIWIGSRLRMKDRRQEIEMQHGKQRKRKIAHCHWGLKAVAEELCGAAYEEVMRHDKLYKSWQEQNPGVSKKDLQKLFIAKRWGRFVAPARATLAHMLTRPIDEKQKEEIMEMLVLDSTLIRGRKNPAMLAGTVIART